MTLRARVNKMTKTEIAEFPGFCILCGKPIYTGQVIIRSSSGNAPVAAHADCHPDFKVGGSSD